MYTVLKLSGMALIVLCTTLIGVSLARALAKRVAEIEAGIAVLTAMEGELSYTLAPPDEMIKTLEQRESLADAGFLPACASLCRRGVPFPQAWRDAVLGNQGCMTPEDTAVLSGLADTLGQCDLHTQLAHIAGAKQQLFLQLENARTYCLSHTKLYHTMGLLSGAFIVVILI